MTVNDLLYNCFKIPVSNLVALFVAILLLKFIANFAIKWNMFSKANKHGWASIVPFYRHYVYYDICFGNGWFFLMPFVFFVICFVPYVGFVGMFMLLVWYYIRKYQMVRAFGRDGMLTILAVMFSTEVLTIPFDYDGKKRLALNPYWQGFLSEDDKAKLKGYTGYYNEVKAFFEKPNEDFSDETIDKVMLYLKETYQQSIITLFRPEKYKQAYRELYKQIQISYDEELVNLVDNKTALLVYRVFED